MLPSPSLLPQIPYQGNGLQQKGFFWLTNPHHLARGSRRSVVLTVHHAYSLPQATADHCGGFQERKGTMRWPTPLMPSWVAHLSMLLLSEKKTYWVITSHSANRLNWNSISEKLFQGTICIYGRRMESRNWIMPLNVIMLFLIFCCFE